MKISLRGLGHLPCGMVLVLTAKRSLLCLQGYGDAQVPVGCVMGVKLKSVGNIPHFCLFQALQRAFKGNKTFSLLVSAMDSRQGGVGTARLALPLKMLLDGHIRSKSFAGLAARSGDSAVVGFCTVEPSLWIWKRKHAAQQLQ